jgi:hypothetical protein
MLEKNTRKGKTRSRLRTLVGFDV